MNEQIEILFKQAGGYVEVDNEGNYFTYTQDFDPDLFAELIVRECAKIATYPQLGDEESYYGNEFAKAIKKHFGVEEK